MYGSEQRRDKDKQQQQQQPNNKKLSSFFSLKFNKMKISFVVKTLIKVHFESVSEI